MPPHQEYGCKNAIRNPPKCVHIYQRTYCLLKSLRLCAKAGVEVLTKSFGLSFGLSSCLSSTPPFIPLYHPQNTGQGRTKMVFVRPWQRKAKLSGKSPNIKMTITEPLIHDDPPLIARAFYQHNSSHTFTDYSKACYNG